MSDAWPQDLTPVRGPFSEARIDGAADGMGDHGPATRSIAEGGRVPPDLICGMTLFLLARQPRAPRAPESASPESGSSESGSSQSEPANPNTGTTRKATPIAGGVWVREQFVIHRPLSRTDAFLVTGQSTGRYVRKGRRYGTNIATASDQAGRLVASNLTTGLLSYKADPDRADEVEGLPLDQTPSPEPDWRAAAANPHRDTIGRSMVSQSMGGQPVTVSLAMMAARDTASPDNPIHSDLEQAKQAGLAAPIAGGSHVLAFALEPLLATWGTEALSHGTKFDIRWRAPTEAGAVIVPSATVAEVTADRVVVDLSVELAGDDGPGVVAMVGTITVPLADSGPGEPKTESHKP